MKLSHMLAVILLIFALAVSGCRDKTYVVEPPPTEQDPPSNPPGTD